MKNPRTDIIKGFASALGSIEYNSTAVPVFSASPVKNTDVPYIQLGSINTIEEGCKDTFGHACTIDIQVIDTSAKNRRSPKVVEEITQLVQTALKPTVTSTIALDNFDMINLVLTNTIQDPNIFETSNASRTIMQWSFDVYERPEFVWLLENNYWNDEGFWVDTATWPA